ncbi:Uncharacterised protein [Collinsella intestinalis]|nr:Uncharacterised protein [Collinsella intestinalis]
MSSQERSTPSSCSSSGLSCCAIQSPVQFARSSVEFPAPVSFDRFARSASLVRTGASRSTPTSDHVPQETNTSPGSNSTLATALAVSCSHTRTMRMPAATSSAMAPASEPSGSMTGIELRAILASSSIAGSHCLTAASINCVVEAMLDSVAHEPVSMCVMRSGTMRRRRSPEIGPSSRTWATSCESVLMSSIGIPVREYESSRNLSRSIMSATPAVRASRYPTTAPWSRPSASIKP